jgi:catechol 2,3-dioxygenase-like lactoylglutathione lyase family enzyme
LHEKEKPMATSVRYIVSDVDAAIAFYTAMLDFKVDIHPAPGFARILRGDLCLLLNRPGAGGAGQAMPDGQAPIPGGWNRIQIEVDDLEATVEKLKGAGCKFRNTIVAGNGGKQILVEDPSGNPIELFEPSRR